MEIFIATSIKSFDLNPTHPGPLPRASFHTSANQQIERSESKAARGRARRATNEVGDRLPKSASSDQDELTNGSSLNGVAMIASSRVAELQHVPPAWKFCAVRSQERLDRENAQSRPPEVENHGAATKNIARQPGSRPRKKRGRNREEVEVLRGSLHGVARVLQAALHLQLQEAVLLPGCADGGHVFKPASLS